MTPPDPTGPQMGHAAFYPNMTAEQMKAKFLSLSDPEGTLNKRISELEAEIAALREDKLRINWLAPRCYLPGDHPMDELCVLVPVAFAPIGAFTCHVINDERAFRSAIDAARKSAP